ncbi:limonene-1,2-epoxide hydrolase [Rhodococcus sp. KBS0724]|jgi:limonene-1,2-epoxide hydrolase|uniref:limonene-1,2-epoxide hydrolase family protein n=1 Tax=Rhodococcus sp. KBS0724 TaxID=1179674 RepID=UPI00110D5460|nr:limonene-1,2-epoxide hydrolase family protein [Rhodococcus sp. KBS0724]TSD46362.1 limonene-1,2-epoxide hydrolase [Rhodococcus sp. KBS0724]
MTPDTLVTEFCKEWADADIAKIVDYFTDDIVYHNIPMEPVVGREAVRAFIEQFVGAFGNIDYQVKRQVANGSVVMNERVDVFAINGAEVALPVMGVFEIRDGKISAWRDYFDMAPITAAAGQG